MQRRRPAEMLLNGLTRKCSSEHRRGRGTLPRQNWKATPAGAAQAARWSVSELSETAMQRRRPAEMLLNGLTRKCSSEHRRGRGTLQRKVGKRLERRRGPGICPVKKVEVPGFEPGQTEPKSVVLPLHHTSIPACKYNNYSHPRRHLRPLPPDNMLKHSGKAALLRAPLPDFPDTAARLAAHRLALKYELTSSEHSPERTPDTVTVLGCRRDGEKREKPRLGSAAP